MLLSLFSISVFIAFWAMVGYPISLRLLDKFFKPKVHDKNLNYEPNVSLMIVAHNEEKVIEEKLKNAITLDYPKVKLQIIVTSDCSEDKTNEIVEGFINNHPDYNIVLHKTVVHKGKTNAQNEGQKLANGEILVMTDANSKFEASAIKELVSYFTNENIAYVCGKLVYSNKSNSTSDSESTYWNLDLKMRDIESRFQTITAGNGAIYACRNKDYLDINPIYCHDSMMPYLYALQNKRAIFNPDAIAYEKAGSNDNDEFKRKVRMNRCILTWFRKGIKSLNFLKYKWFSFFFFSHRLCRYSLWLAHSIAFASSFIAMIRREKWGKLFTLIQIFLGLIAVFSLKLKIKNKMIRMIGYYVMTVFAQIVGVRNCVFGKSKATWEKAESTR